MKTDDRLLSGASSEPSLNPNKSSGDIVDKLVRIADASRRDDGSDIPLGEQCRDAAAEIERLRRERYNLIADLADMKARALTAESDVSAAYENAAKIAEAKALEFLSPEYATGQPLSSFNERFACEQVASAIRAAVSKKTAESGHSPSTHNSASE
jgi:hypothetical protein